MDINDLRIGFLMADPFPVGGARTIRMTIYAKYLNKADIFFKVYVLKGTESAFPIRNAVAKGEFEGIPFEYVLGKTTWNIRHPKPVKLWLVLRGIAKAMKQIRKERIDTLIINSESLLYILSFWVYCRVFGIKYIAEKSELPFHIKLKKSRLYGYCYDKVYQCFDAMFVISEEIRQYLQPRMRKGREIFLLPMLVDMERFENLKKEKAADYIAYCGGINNDRDGIRDMFEAYRLFSENRPEVKFYFIGNCTPTPQNRDLIEYVKKQKLEEKINFMGMRNMYEIPSLLYNARLLLMAPDRDFNSGGFPTKLGEYLATGNPVVVTKVSDIPVFLENDKTAFLAEPGNCVEIADAMAKVFRQPELAAAVGNAGKRLAAEKFSFPPYLTAFTDFLRRVSAKMKT